MDPSSNLSHGDIDDLVKTSKQLQNQMRQELRRQGMGSSLPASGERGELPPLWDNVMMNPYVKNVVADYLADNSTPTSALDGKVHVKKPVKQDKPESKGSVRRTTTLAAKTSNMPSKEAVKTSQRISVAVATQVTQIELPEPPKKEVKPKARNTNVSPNKAVKTKSMPAKTGELEARKNNHEWCKTTIKHSSSLQRIPLQRFAGTSKRNIDFSEEHPDLELDSSPNQTTLFPRRLPKGSKCNIRSKSSLENNSINLAAAEVKPPEAVAAAAAPQQETWKEVLLRNRSTERPHKVVRSKKRVEAASSNMELSTKEPKVIDIISKPPNGLFHMAKQNGRLSKQKKCAPQHFPVMYIRPECQVQRVASISIRGNGEGSRLRNESENFSANVKYVEYTHEEKKPDAGSSLPRVETDIANDKHKEDTPMKQNKFFKALQCTPPLRDASLSRESSSSAAKLSNKMRSRTYSTYSRSSLKAQSFFSPPSDETTDNDVHHIIEGMLSSSDWSQSTTTKDVIRNPATRREVYVQTDNKETDATSLPQMPIPPPSPRPQSPPSRLPAELTSSITFSKQHHPTAGRRQTTKHENDNYVEDDFINKIFERIRNDVPHAVQAFKDRSTTAHEAAPPECTCTKQLQEQKQSQQHQMSAISNASNVDLPPNEMEPGLTSIQAKRHDASRTILQMPPPVTLHSVSTGGDDRNFLLLQQNPLFVETINRIKSSAITGDGRIKEDRHKYPTDAEIKRAVKIFLDSLTLDDADGGSGGRKSIIKGDGVRKEKHILPRSELIRTRRYTKCISSVSSNTSNMSTSSSKIGNENKMSNRLHSDVSGSSTSTTIFTTDSELEIDVTVDLRPRPQTDMTGTSLSEGEVLSIGEI